MNRRKVLQGGLALAGLSQLPRVHSTSVERDKPILVVVELSGGNDGLNSVVPYEDAAYYRARPTIGIAKSETLLLDDYYGMNPGMLGLHRLWQQDKLAIVHGCGYDQPSFSHFTSMAYWHTASPHRGSEFGWLGRVADAIAAEQRDNMLINIGARQSLAVKSARHTPLVFDDPNRFQRSQWLGESAEVVEPPTGNRNRDFLSAVNQSAATSAAMIRQAWRDYSTDVDYGIAPMDLPKVAACIQAGLDTQLYHVSFRNNSFDTHVQQPALHQRLLSYACDGIYGFVRDLERLKQDHRVTVLVFSEFGRRVAENANLGTDHGSANVMFVAGTPVKGGHYGQPPSLTDLHEHNLSFTTDFRQVYATVIEDWLGVDAQRVLGSPFARFPLFA